MWYVGTRNSSKPRVCYAESHDGLTWEKPQLGICEYGGNKQNNIVIQPEYPNGFLDDCSMIYEPDDEWPYKLLYWDWGIFATRSKDGIHFESIGKVLPKWNDRFIAVTEKVDGKYRIYGRGTFETGLDEFGNWKGGIRHVTEYALDPFPRKRPVVYTESEDLHNWTAGEQIIKPDTSDPFQMQFYSLSPFRYAGIWLADLLRMHAAPDVLDPELVWSYDGRNWNRSHERKPFIPLGPKGAFDSVWLNLATNAPSSTTTSSGSTTRDEPGAMAHSFPARTGPSAWRRFGSTGSARSIQAAPREAYPEAYSPSRFRGSTAISS